MERQMDFTEYMSVKRAFEARNDLQRYNSNALLLFALQLKFQIEDIDTIAVNSLTDSNDDKKCDLVFVDNDKGCAVVAQSYISQDETKAEAKANKAADLNTAASWILTRPIEELPFILQPAAIELREALTNKTIRSLQFWYVHNLPCSENVKNELHTVANTAQSAISRHFPDSEVIEISAIEVGRETLTEWYQSLTIPILVSDSFEVDVPGGFALKSDDNEWEAFVTAVPAKWVYSLFEQYKSNLFSANVRGYLGSRNVEQNINNGIKQTVVESPSLFWAYNNGLTALVNGFLYDTDTHKLKIDGVSIVNGAQTTGAVGSVSREPGDSAMVSARFVKCVNTEIIKNIIKFNNSQNRIEAPDFRSNDPIQRRLVSEFDEIPNALYLGGRRGGDEDIIKRPPNLLPSDTVAQSLLSFHSNPIVAYNEKSRIWLSDNLYSTCFSERTKAKHIIFVYSLVKAIEQKKLELNHLENISQITESQKKQLDFLRYRGAIFLFTYAISRCLEIFLSQAIPDRFKVSFSASVSPENAKTLWEPIIRVAIPFCDKLSPAIEQGLKTRDVVTQVVDDFRRLVESVSSLHAQTFAHFKERIVIE